MRKIHLTEEQFKNYCRLKLQEARKEEYLKNLIRESVDYNEDYSPDPLTGNFEAYQDGSEVPFVGVYYYRINKTPQTYDYPGDKDYVLDNVQFVGIIPQNIKEAIIDAIKANLQSGEDGDMEIEF